MWGGQGVYMMLMYSQDHHYTKKRFTLPRITRSINGVDISVLFIGNPAYPLFEWLVKPFSDTGRLSRDQHNFNCRPSRARNVVENAYGRLKARWRCFYNVTIAIYSLCVSRLLSVVHYTIFVKHMERHFATTGCKVMEHFLNRECLAYVHQLEYKQREYVMHLSPISRDTNLYLHVCV